MAALPLDRILQSCLRNHRADQIVVDAGGRKATIPHGTAKFPPICTKSQKQEEFLCAIQGGHEAGHALGVITNALAGSAQGSTEQCRGEFATGKSAANSWMGLHAVTQASHCLNEGRTQLSPQASDEDFNRIRIAVEVLGVNMFGELAL